MTPACLRCEYLRDPLGIDAQAPLLTQTLAGNGEGRALDTVSIDRTRRANV